MTASFYRKSNYHLIPIFIGNKSLTVFFLVVLTQFLTSCSKEPDEYQNLPGINFGTTSYYDSFLFSDSQNLPLKKKLKTNFNNWAISNDAEVEFTLIQEDGTVIGLPNSETQVLINGQLSPDGHFKLSSKGKKVDTLNIELQFSPTENSRNLSGFLQMQSGNIERVNNIEISEPQTKLFKWNAQQNVIMNPLKKGLLWFLAILFGAILIWFLFLRNLVYPKMGNGQLIINSPYFKSIKTKGLREITFTDKPIQQGKLSKIFAAEKLLKKIISGRKKSNLHPQTENKFV